MIEGFDLRKSVELLMLELGHEDALQVRTTDMKGMTKEKIMIMLADLESVIRSLNRESLYIEVK